MTLQPPAKTPSHVAARPRAKAKTKRRRSTPSFKRWFVGDLVQIVALMSLSRREERETLDLIARASGVRRIIELDHDRVVGWVLRLRDEGLMRARVHARHVIAAQSEPAPPRDAGPLTGWGDWGWTEPGAQASEEVA